MMAPGGSRPRRVVHPPCWPNRAGYSGAVLSQARCILIVDDDPRDRELIVHCLRENGVGEEIRAVRSGREAIAYLEGDAPFEDRSANPYPAMILTDLKMPDGDGYTVLEFLKSHPESAIVPVLVFSSSDDADDVKRSYQMGAACFLQKPQNLVAMGDYLRKFYDFWSLCRLPDVDLSGRQLPTNHLGKLGERFGAT